METNRPLPTTDRRQQMTGKDHQPQPLSFTVPTVPETFDSLLLARNGLCSSVTRTISFLEILLQQKPSAQNDVQMYLAILVEDEASLKGLDKLIADAVDYNSIEEELTTTIEYEETICHMRTSAHIAGWPLSAKADPINDNYEFAHTFARCPRFPRQ